MKTILGNGKLLGMVILEIIRKNQSNEIVEHITVHSNGGIEGAEGAIVFNKIPTLIGEILRVIVTSKKYYLFRLWLLTKCRFVYLKKWQNDGGKFFG